MDNECVRRLIRLDKNILVFSGNVLANTLRKCMHKLEFSDNVFLVIYEGWDDISGNQFMAVCKPLMSVHHNDDFSENEKNEIWQLIKENDLFEKRAETYVVKILRAIVEKQEIELMGIFFHEIRHVQQIIYTKGANTYESLCSRLEEATHKKSELQDLKFEKDAIIYSRYKLREIGFSESEIKSFLKEYSLSRWEQFMYSKLSTVAEAVS